MGENQRKKTAALREATESMTIHGLPHLFGHEPRLMKAFWLVVFLGLVGVSTWLIYLRLLDYHKHEVYIKTESKILQPMPFPAVTVCNSDRLSGEFFAGFDLTNMSCNNPASTTATSQQLIEFQKACKMFLSGFKDTIRFGGKEIAPFPNAFQSSDALYPCFTFNKNGLAEQMINGVGRGLDIILFNDPADVVPISRANVSRFEDRRQGILIQIHDPETDASMDSSFIVISPGQSYDIVISRKTFSRKKHPFPSNCHTLETTKYKQKGGRYTRSNCIFSCFQMKLQQQCGDVFSMNKSASQKICEAQFLKMRPIRDCDCPEPCYQVLYPNEISTATWPKKFQLQSMKKEFSDLLNLTDAIATDIYLQKRFAKIKIFYKELIYTASTEEELYGFGSLVSEIGGIMGLFIGVSVISLAELIWLFGLSIKRLVAILCHLISRFGMKGIQPKNDVEMANKLAGNNGHAHK